MPPSSEIRAHFKNARFLYGSTFAWAPRLLISSVSSPMACTKCLGGSIQALRRKENQGSSRTRVLILADLTFSWRELNSNQEDPHWLRTISWSSYFHMERRPPAIANHFPSYFPTSRVGSLWAFLRGSVGFGRFPRMAADRRARQENLDESYVLGA